MRDPCCAAMSSACASSVSRAVALIAAGERTRATWTGTRGCSGRMAPCGAQESKISHQTGVGSTLTLLARARPASQSPGWGEGFPTRRRDGSRICSRGVPWSVSSSPGRWPTAPKRKIGPSPPQSAARIDPAQMQVKWRLTFPRALERNPVGRPSEPSATWHAPCSPLGKITPVCVICEFYWPGGGRRRGFRDVLRPPPQPTAAARWAPPPNPVDETRRTSGKLSKKSLQAPLFSPPARQ